MELLPEGKKNTVQVTLEDQQKINEFSKLIMRKDVCEADLSQQRQEKEYLEDVSLEIELIDEDEKVQYKIGELFVFLKQSEVVEQLEKDGEVIDEKIEKLESRETEINERLATLKGELYAKFGDNINLER
ncbi:similar to Saccharomyces cerevisiae YNL153C GIM3 Subunit of the heterohexameric cochaperone prefoldin complex which binds specifically to cytosolic chaperonin and transfers target proteins to it [Maudiozyma saulgeensis]|uniref:Prefoldin subunit 4 n=1 Tax=Maudiozyma saulgeensis TaxID=1789683 RepID=A0A1X7RB21_9SACH|nr:similar to Saccharomyces cerevisiae YNL153C GIM3 Subunit of the heterohexameric cochaperone prefoldin complex which binds specifically to cytosolic chaperonin and transfers target proteins to it [Kazachstania saulgeensis]